MLRVARLALVLCGVSLWLGACDDEPSGPSQLGMRCEIDADCGELQCIAETRATPDDLDDEPLVCGALSAEAAAPGEACEGASDCDRGLCLLSGACARPCVEASDCDGSERCQAVFARRGPETLTTLSACVSAVDLPDGVEVERELRRDAIDGDTVEVTLPAVDERATTLFVLEHESPAWPDTVLCRPPLCVKELRAGAETLFRSDTCATGELPRVPIATGDHIDPVVVRLAGAGAALGADDGYVATLNSEADGDLRVTRIASRERRQRLDLNLFYVGASELEPEGDRGPSFVADALEVLDSIYEPADIFIGEVRQIRVGGALPERGLAFPDGDQRQGFAFLAVRFGVYVELPYLFRLSAGASNPAINVFFVGDIEPRLGSEPEAEAGGIPGPLGMHGTGGSGIVVAADMMGSSSALGRTLAHEIGHYLGLFHTSEGDGCVRDVLSDTSECRAEDDIAGDGLDVADCVDHGSDNLMFFAKTTGTVLTPQQIEVLRSAPILQ